MRKAVVRRSSWKIPLEHWIRPVALPDDEEKEWLKNTPNLSEGGTSRNQNVKTSEHLNTSKSSATRDSHGE